MHTVEWRAGTQSCHLQRWSDFRRELAESIRILHQIDGLFIVIACRKKHRFVQFASESGGVVIGEAVGNHYLEEAEQLTPSTSRQLAQVGWRSPGKSDELGSGNYWYQWRLPAPIKEIVSLAVRTLREVFGTASPAELEIRRDCFGANSLARSAKKGYWIPPSEDPSLRLRSGRVVHSTVSSRQYQVGERLGAGGFGAVYRVVQLAGPEPLPLELCLKVAVVPEAWHREAYFGELLAGVAQVIQVHESFAWIRRGKNARPLYCLITEFAEGGDLTH